MSIVLAGERELIAALKKLPNNVFKRVVVGASRKAMRPVITAARAAAPVDTGLLKKSIGAKVKVYPRKGNIVSMVGARGGFKDKDTKQNPAIYAHLVEGGHVLRRIKKGPVIGRVAAKPFLKPAFGPASSQIVGRFRDMLRAGIDREAAKVGRKR